MIIYYFKKRVKPVSQGERKTVYIPFSLVMRVFGRSIQVDYDPSRLENMTLFFLKNQVLIEEGLEKKYIKRFEIFNPYLDSCLRDFKDVCFSGEDKKAVFKSAEIFESIKDKLRIYN